MTHLGDITKIDWFHVPPADVVTGGSPCQDLSVAGKRAGLAGRGTLRAIHGADTMRKGVETGR